METESKQFQRKRIRALAACMLICLCTGIGYTWSVFQTPFMEMFGWNTRETSLTYTFMVVTSTILPIFIGGFQPKIGLRRYVMIGVVLYCTGLILTGFTRSLPWLYLSFGFVTGMGGGMVYTTMMSYSVRLMPEKKGLAGGLMTGTYGAGSVIWAPLSSALAANIGFLPVFRVFGGCFMVVMLLMTWQLFEVPQSLAEAQPQTAQATEVGKDLHWRQMLKTGRFYLVILCLAVGTSSGLMVMSHASPMMQTGAGITASTAAMLMGMVAAANTSGRFLCGAASDRLGRFRVVSFLFLFLGLCMLGLAFTTGALFVVVLLFTAVFYGGATSMLSPLAADLFGTKYLNLNYNFFYASYGIASVVGPQLAALFVDRGQGYTPAFLVMVIPVLLSAATIYGCFVVKRRKKEVG